MRQKLDIGTCPGGHSCHRGIIAHDHSRALARRRYLGGANRAGAGAGAERRNSAPEDGRAREKTELSTPEKVQQNQQACPQVQTGQKTMSTKIRWTESGPRASGKVQRLQRPCPPGLGACPPKSGGHQVTDATNQRRLASQELHNRIREAIRHGHARDRGRDRTLPQPLPVQRREAGGLGRGLPQVDHFAVPEAGRIKLWHTIEIGPAR